MTDYGKLYDEFLYDCYIANQRLTDEDWLYYGREEHHIEIPNRDGGLLTPLNSQYLTTYQHWIAGVLQSEVLGKRCFAMVPKSVLPLVFELLRSKWQVIGGREGKLAELAKYTPEERSEQARKAVPTTREKYTREEIAAFYAAGHQRMTPEQRSERSRKGNATLTSEQRAEKTDHMRSFIDPEKRREAARQTIRKVNATRTTEARREAAIKAWETKRRKQHEALKELSTEGEE